MSAITATRLLASCSSARLQSCAQGPVNLCLRGEESGGSDVQLFFSGARLGDAIDPAAPAHAAPLALPHQWRDVQIIERQDAQQQTFWQLRSLSRTLDIQARSVQVHRSTGSVFFAALPAANASWSQRLGWRVLLDVLRVPGGVRLITYLRSR